jgi:hypothetical protein
VPQSSKSRASSTGDDAISRELQAVWEDLLVTAAMKQVGFTATLKSLNRGRLPAPSMMTVYEGVVEELPSGKFDASLQTDRGRLALRDAERTDRPATDPQLLPSDIAQSPETIAHSGEPTADELLRQLADAGPNASSGLLCAIELTRFLPPQRQALLPLLWQYILDHRGSNDRDRLVGVAAAIRKYIAIMPMDRMGELAILLEAGHRSPLPIELEIEVAKMVYRNFEAHPPAIADPQPELARRFWEMVQAYIDPRILLRDKYSAATSLAIEAIVSMRSPLGEVAWRKAITCPYRWFAELVNDDIEDLCERWEGKNRDAAAWLNELRTKVLAVV